jgi:predicted AAA+ superfamily ATPase
MFYRKIERLVKNSLFQKKALIILGARQTGKTTLVKNILQTLPDYQTTYLNCDETVTRETLIEPSLVELGRIVSDNKIVVIDEAQRVKNIGLTLKLMVDNFPDCQLIVTGSSSLELANEINEPLTGRKFEYLLFPISWAEFSDKVGYLAAKSQLETRMVYGMYPDVINNVGQENKILQNLASSYLYKDLFNYQAIRKPELLDKLLKALALQIGSEVSYTELGGLLGIDKNTVESYISLLEKSFVIFRLNPFSRNIRNELNKKRKIYFYDTGIRNAIIGDFKPLNLRTDTGHLWENFLIAERFKRNEYREHYASSYFWRTHQQQEIDYVEDHNGQLASYEFKWNDNQKVKVPLTFKTSYPDATFEGISPSNFYDFVV